MLHLCYVDVRSSYSHASLALPLLERAAAAAGVSDVRWSRVLATVGDRLSPAVAEAVRLEPQILTATAYLFNRDWLLAFVRRVKALRPQCLVILGGPEFLGHNEAFLRQEPAVDAVFRGEGEASLPQLLRALAARPAGPPGRQPPHLSDSAASLAGFCLLDRQGAYGDAGRATVSAEQMAALPPATASPLFAWGKPFIQVETTRGCPHACSFCTSCRTGRPRAFPARRVRAELDAAAAHGVRDIRVLDRTFNLEPAHAENWLRIFLEEYPQQRFHLELHPGALSAGLRALLAAAAPGRVHLEVGLQTTHRAALAACGRGGDPDRDWDGLAFLAACRNLELHVDLLAGLPQLTFAKVLDDVHRLVALGVNEIQLEILKILPGTPLADQASARGIAFSPVPPYEVLRTPHMSTDDLVAAAGISVLVDAFHNHPALRDIVRGAVARHPGFFVSLLAAVTLPAGGAPAWSLEARLRLLFPFVQADSAARALFARQWLGHGLSPAVCPAGAARPWKKPLPASAVLAEGVADVNVAAARVWHLELPDGEWWFVFDRSRHPTGPAAVFHKPAAGPPAE